MPEEISKPARHTRRAAHSPATQPAIQTGAACRSSRLPAIHAMGPHEGSGGGGGGGSLNGRPSALELRRVRLELPGASIKSCRDLLALAQLRSPFHQPQAGGLGPLAMSRRRVQQEAGSDPPPPPNAKHPTGGVDGKPIWGGGVCGWTSTCMGGSGTGTERSRADRALRPKPTWRTAGCCPAQFICKKSRLGTLSPNNLKIRRSPNTHAVLISGTWITPVMGSSHSTAIAEQLGKG
jgi:hypothetical protein